MDKKQRTIEGVVVSDKMAKTVVISITHTRMHPKYLKTFKVTRKFKAHDEGEVCGVGDNAVIRESRPLSRTKRWVVVECKPTSKSSELKENTEIK